ncbi:hypothetical protein KKC60_01300, partial [Patescibacteria group bacterium]|nr:hypothetical protein [Patescibacteria group bacterium]
ETGKSSKDYLNLLQAQQEYQHESGQTLEDWLTLFTTYLKKTNQVISDYKGNGNYSRLIGSYHPASGKVLVAYWYRDSRWAGLNGDFSSFRDSGAGACPAVRIGG